MLVQWFRHFARLVIERPPPALRVVVLVVAVVLYGATGFLYFEQPVNPSLNWMHSFWYAVVTITTVGYGDLSPETFGGRYIVAFPLMFFGIGLLGYVLSLSASALVEAKAKELNGMSQVTTKNHLVLFNFSGLGKVIKILEELAQDSKFTARQVVLVDEDLEELPPELVERGVRYVRGNPTRDATLSRASVDSADVAIVLSKHPGDAHSDALTVAITLAIEARNPDVSTVVECVDYSTEELLRKAGSDRIVCTSRFDAHFVSQEVLNPGVQEVIAQLTTNLRGQQVYITPFEAKSTGYAELSARCQARGHLLLGVRADGETRINPGAEHRVERGASVVTIGPKRLDLA